MKTNAIKANNLFWIGVLLTIPTAYFISINLINEFGYPYLFNSTQPLLEQMGSKESIGFNVNLLILFGPLIALLLNLFSVLKFDWVNENENLSIKFSLKKNWWNILKVMLPGLLLIFLFFYAIGENCHS